MPADAVSLEAAAGPDPTHVLGLKSCAILFVVFLTVTSSCFVDSVLCHIGHATVGRDPTAFGATLQGVFLVVLYAAGLHLARVGVV